LGIYAFNEGTDANWYWGNPHDTPDKFVINRKAGTSFDDATAQPANSLMTIDSVGNVGIGTTAPSAKLDLVGGIARLNGVEIGDFLESAHLIEARGFVNGLVLRAGENFSSGGYIYIKPTGDVGIGTTTPQAKLDVAGKINCTVLELTSDRHAKANFRPLNLAEVLEKISGLSITEWEFTNAPGVRHCGAMAQDFREKFGLGTDDKHINPLDAASVALAGVQALREELQKTKAQLSARDAELAALKSAMTNLKQDVTARLAAVEKAIAQTASIPAVTARPLLAKSQFSTASDEIRQP
jgi:hypothetical protein